MSSPYYLFGAQRRYPASWFNGAGGVQQSRLAAESRELGIFDLVESGLDPSSIPASAFRNTRLHRPNRMPVGDWPLMRPAGPEPIFQLAGFVADNEKLLALAGIAGFAAYLMMRKPHRR